MDAYQDKKFKVEYLQHQQSFISEMKSMSSELKKCDISKRFDKLML